MEEPTKPKPRKRAPGAGRKPLSATGQKTIRARVTTEQAETWDAMPNASEWLRAQLDAIKATAKPAK